MKNVNLTKLEEEILQRSRDPEVTQRRRRMILVTGVCAAAFLVWAAFARQSWQLVLVVSLVYVAVTMCEKVAYANAVLAYKSVIRKLSERIEELESSQQNVGGDSDS